MRNLLFILFFVGARARARAFGLSRVIDDYEFIGQYHDLHSIFKIND